MRGQPAPTAWERYRAYECDGCGVDCIDPYELPWTKYGECERCWRLPVLEEADRSISVPGLAPQSTARGGEAEAARTGASAPSAGQAEADRPRGLPLATEAGPQPPTTGKGATSGGSGEAAAQAFLASIRQATLRTDGGER